MGIILAGSSHTSKATKQLREKYSPSITTCKGFGGLQVLAPQSPKKKEQFLEFKSELIARSKLNTQVILITLSNDWEKLLKNHKNHKEGGLLDLRDNAKGKWLSMTPEERSTYTHTTCHMLKEKPAAHLKNKLNTYKQFLTNMAKMSEFDTIYQASVLERRHINYDNLHLEILFANLNSHLKTLIENLKLKNKLGKDVKVKFLNLAFQYHSDNTFWDFKHAEVENWKLESNFRTRNGKPSVGKWKFPVSLTHRSESSLIEILKFLNSEIQA
jgi:hypothetical protein